jgi:CRP/FNR family transcriptional regulator, cyclic AMP receptor protein
MSTAGTPSPDISQPQSLQPPLAHIPLFARLNPDEQISLLALMSHEHFEAHQTIFWFGDLGDSLYLISQGAITVSVPTDTGKEMALNRLGVGGFVGELGLLDGGPRTATVRAAEPTDVFVLSRENFHRFLRDHPAAAIDILTVMGTRQRTNTLALRGTKNANVLFEQGRTTLWQHASDRIASVAASQWFTLFHIMWFGIWIIWNLLGAFGHVPPRLTWDPYPFGLLTMIVSLEAIFLSIMVMVSQNRQSQKDRLRVELDYQVNVKAQTEIMSMARQLERVESLLQAHVRPPEPR